MSFSNEVDSFITKAKFKSDEEFGKAVLAFHNDIMTGTPVDEGTLKNNWQLGVNAINSEQKPAHKGGAGARESAKRGTRGLQIKDTAIIFNNMEYAEAIERGLGKGARIPARMVELAIIMAQARNKTQ